MQDAITQALVSKMGPVINLVGLVVVLGILSFGGTLINLWWQSGNSKEDKREKQLESMRQSLSDLTISNARVEAKLDLLARKYDKDLNALGNKIRQLEA